MENSITPKSDFLLLTEILPHYKQLNYIYFTVREKLKLNYLDQLHVTDFYNQYNDIIAFDKSLLNFSLFIDKKSQLSIIKNLTTEIKKNIELYSNNKSFFDNIDIMDVCDEFLSGHRQRIKLMEEGAYRIFHELNGTKHELESESWKGNKIVGTLHEEVKQIQAKHEKYCSELDELYSLEYEDAKNASRYFKNIFGEVCQLNQSLLTCINYYFPDEYQSNTLNEVEYFKMDFVLLIYTEFNDQLFKKISIVDFYHNINLLPAQVRLEFAENEKERVVFYVYKLYNYLKKKKCKECVSWRNNICEILKIDMNFYRSKSTCVNSALEGSKSYNFKQKINQIIT
ncbi:hypothetical protein Palpr_1584 [Paludibacter propionicigenes WB4]|uniref:Uncharacterized protein n=1 Tax=Paludibacter propionicigenes (strain DSM 17365 / JCM 13257 / WB4) TaxID=694427 RepID=E4T4T5_PALPW|nr:hypothetical protein [Paludibacter propionicigenes]ADQ79729.1 hypothetical protein Palpr_1584 [Paludibacter propionicigenes WB4]